MSMTYDGGVAALQLLLRQGGATAVRRAREAMKREADRIVKLAQDNAPVLHHDILSGHHVVSLGAHYVAFNVDDMGPLARSIRREDSYEDNQRLQIEILVGDEETARYADLMHEGLAPYGSGTAGKLGPLSQMKASTGKDVGGKFLERAYLEREDKIPDEIIAEINDLLGEFL